MLPWEEATQIAQAYFDEATLRGPVGAQLRIQAEAQWRKLMIGKCPKLVDVGCNQIIPSSTTPTRVPISGCTNCGHVVHVPEWINQATGGAMYDGSSLDQLQKKMRIVKPICPLCGKETLANPVMGFACVPALFGGTLEGASAQDEERKEDASLYKIPPSSMGAGPQGSQLTGLSPFGDDPLAPQGTNTTQVNTSKEDGMVEEGEYAETEKPRFSFLVPTCADELRRVGRSYTESFASAGGVFHVGNVYRPCIGDARAMRQVTEFCSVFLPTQRDEERLKDTSASPCEFSSSAAPFLNQQDQYIGRRGRVISLATPNRGGGDKELLETFGPLFPVPFFFAELLLQIANFASAYVSTGTSRSPFVWRQSLDCEFLTPPPKDTIMVAWNLESNPLFLEGVGRVTCVSQVVATYPRPNLRRQADNAAGNMTNVTISATLDFEPLLRVAATFGARTDPISGLTRIEMPYSSAPWSVCVWTTPLNASRNTDLDRHIADTVSATSSGEQGYTSEHLKDVMTNCAIHMRPSIQEDAYYAWADKHGVPKCVFVYANGDLLVRDHLTPQPRLVKFNPIVVQKVE